MGKDSKIEWTHHTFNPVRGCRRISPGCDHCYAEMMSRRNPRTLGVWGRGDADGERVHAAESYWRQPAKWNEAAKAAGEVHRVFVASLADLFEGEPHPNGAEGRDGPRADYLPMLDRLVETFAPLTNLRVLALTKRTWNAAQWAHGRGGWPSNWWLGFTAEDQVRFELRAAWAAPPGAEVVFVSCEPLLGPLDFHDDDDGLGGPFSLLDLYGIGWVIAGGESGGGARPMHPDWARGIRDQSVAAGRPFLFKQWGEHDEHGARVGKHAAGRLLDGRTWDEVPDVG